MKEAIEFLGTLGPSLYLLGGIGMGLKWAKNPERYKDIQDFVGKWMIFGAFEGAMLMAKTGVEAARMVAIGALQVGRGLLWASGAITNLCVEKYSKWGEQPRIAPEVRESGVSKIFHFPVIQ